MLNIENIKRVRDLIAGLEDRRFNMSVWAWEKGNCPHAVEPYELIHNCNTCGCTGGWTNALFGGRSSRPAQEALGLSDEQADDLFFNWPNEWSPTAADAVATLDHLIETGKVKWVRAKASQADRVSG